MNVFIDVQEMYKGLYACTCTTCITNICIYAYMYIPGMYVREYVCARMCVHVCM